MPIKVGDRIAETFRPHRVWQVVRIVEPSHGRPHASLRLANDPGESRLLSLAALESDGRYKRVAAEPAPLSGGPDEPRNAA